MENLTFDMLTHYSRSQLQMLIKAAKLSCPKLSRQKHEELIEFILQHQDQIGELPPVQTDGQGPQVRVKLEITRSIRRDSQDVGLEAAIHSKSA